MKSEAKIHLVSLMNKQNLEEQCMTNKTEVLILMHQKLKIPSGLVDGQQYLERTAADLKLKTFSGVFGLLMSPQTEVLQAKREKAGEFWIGGKIVAVENSYNWFAVCCQANDCNSRLIPLPSGEYECKNCLKNWTKGIDKYNLKLQVEDANGNAKLKLVDKDCIQLIGRTYSITPPSNA
nr:replication factor A protein 1-like [Ipomoea batatas]